MAAALPGGDPLAAALAAGETPSPEVLAAAAETEAIPVARSLLLLGALIACVAVYAVLSPRATMAALVPLEKAPAVLADRARQIIADFGYTDTPADSAQNFIIPPDYPRWIVQTDPTMSRWDPARMARGQAVLFWHRTSPRDLVPIRQSTSVSSTDPPIVLTGQTLVVLDTRGRLVEFRRVPPQRDSVTEAPPPPNWDAMFRAASVSIGLRAGDAGVAAEGFRGRAGGVGRAAGRLGSPDQNRSGGVSRQSGVDVHNRAVGAPRSMVPLPESRWSRIRAIFSTALFLAVIASAALLARHNLRTSRADRKGAMRLAGAYLFVQLAAWTISAHHVSGVVEEVSGVFRVGGSLLLQGGILWLLYLALEPYGRRFWPDGLLGWSRLLSGRVRDPRIGRDILVGSALAGALLLIDLFRSLSPLLIGRPPGVPSLGGEVEVLNGFGWLVGTWTDQMYGSLQTALIIVFLLVVVRLLIRRTWLAVIIGIGILVGASGGGVPAGGVGWLYYLAQFMAIGVITLAIFRYGLLVTVVMILMDNIPSAVPILPNGAPWAALPGNLTLALVVALACFGFYAARAGQPLLGNLAAD